MSKNTAFKWSKAIAGSYALTYNNELVAEIERDGKWWVLTIITNEEPSTNGGFGSFKTMRDAKAEAVRIIEAFNAASIEEPIEEPNVGTNTDMTIEEDTDMTQREIDYSDTFGYMPSDENDQSNGGGVQLERTTRKYIHPYTSRKCELCWFDETPTNRMARYEIPSIVDGVSFDLCRDHTREIKDTIAHFPAIRINRGFSRVS